MRPWRPRPRLGLELVDEVDDVEEAASGAAPDAGSCDGDRQMGLAVARAPDQDGIALMGDEVAGRQVAHQRLVDRRALEHELLDVPGQRQLGDGDLVLDRSRLLLGDLGLKADHQTTRLGSCWRFTAVETISSKAAFMP